MRVERAEVAGLGVALAAHGALLWALGLRSQPEPVPPPPMDVSFVEDVGPVAGAPASEPAAQSAAPETGLPEDAAPAASAPIPEPVPRLVPQPQPQPRQAPQQAARQSGSGAATANRGSRLDPDILKGIGSDPAARSDRPAAPALTAEARTGIRGIIRRALLPCERQPLTTPPEARAIQVRVDVTLNRDGTLAGTRTRVINDDPRLNQYEDEIRRAALRVVSQCSLRGLAVQYAQYYDVPNGWRTFPYIFDPRSSR
ncbi:MAG TPA: hypothetical protein VF603_15895 [Allosphingosinicella sp.]|jgi:hypothetical protein